MFFARLSTAKRPMAWALLLSLAIGVLFGYTLWAARQAQISLVSRHSADVAYGLGRAVGHTLDALDYALQGVVWDLADPTIREMTPQQRHHATFDHALRMEGLGPVLVLDAAGNVVMDSQSPEPRKASLAERSYFKALQRGQHKGLHIAEPMQSALNGARHLAISRAYYAPDGRFIGVVVGSINLDYFHKLFSGVALEPQSALRLLRTDGTVLAQFGPEAAPVVSGVLEVWDLAPQQNRRQGSYLQPDSGEKDTYLHTFERVGDYPLVLDVTQSMNTALAAWRRHAFWMGSLALLLMLACPVLAWLWVRQRVHRQEVSEAAGQIERNARMVMDNIPLLVSYWDKNLRNRFINPLSHHWFGFTPEKIRGMQARDVWGGAEFASVEPYFKQALLGHAQQFECPLHNKAGQLCYVSVTCTPDCNVEGEVRGLFVQWIDISDRRQLEDTLFVEKARMDLTLQSMSDGVVYADTHGHVMGLNASTERMGGTMLDKALGADVEAVLPFYLPHAMQRQPHPLQLALQTRTQHGPVRGLLLNPTLGVRYQVEAFASPLVDRAGVLIGAVLVLHDVTENLVMTERITHMTEHDALTDLPNRALLQEHARHAIAHARRDRTSLAVIALNIDGFRQLNGRRGYEVGDLLLVELAHHLHLTVAPAGALCRQGGDGFLIVLPGLEDTGQVRRLVQKVVAAGQACFELHAADVPMGISGGIALFPQHGQTFEILARHAEVALYAAKRAGRARFYVFAGEGADPAPLEIDR